MGVTRNEKTEPSFKEWAKDNSIFAEQVVKENSRWGRVVAVWREKKKDGKVLNHQFAACVNLKNGDVYLDCSKKKLFAKNITLTFARLPHMFMKTAYHASMIGVVKALSNGIKEKQSKVTILKNCGKEFADIVRTPLYGVVLMVISATAAVIIVVYPKSAYDFRNLYGRVEQSLNWGEKHDDWTLAICFQSIFNIRELAMPDDFNKMTLKTFAAERKLIKAEKKCKEDIAALKAEIGELTAQPLSKSKTKRSAAKAVMTEKLNALHELEKQSYAMRFEEIRKYTVGRLDKHGNGETIYDTKMEEALMNLLSILHQKRVKQVNAKDNKERARLEKSVAALEERYETLLPQLQESAILSYRLTHYAAHMINDRRKVWCNPFYQFGKMSPDLEYTSPVMEGNKAFDKVRVKTVSTDNPQPQKAIKPEKPTQNRKKV